MKSRLTYAVIPARGGSKGVPRKNIKLLKGFPLIAYSIAAAKLSKLTDRVIVSTESSEIAEIAQHYGAEVPFLRPAEYAQDRSPDIDFIRHAIDWFAKNETTAQPELFVHLRPTTPLRDPALIDEAIGKIVKNDDATALRSAHELAEPPQKMFAIENGYLAGFFPGDPRPEYYNLPRQVFPKAYHPNGYVDIIRTGYVTRTNTLHGPRMIGFVTPYTIEIDNPDDFSHLEYTLEKQSHPLYEYLTQNY
ncbi:acylneuraminate cytidylyltransferase family protein [uncultured Methanoregula sp.]|uniref:acylneuraminate cytidylyltransferase family protein n=1 Tax=uncultured Methanoregula sp. TaxID=1005933 RepID=UPI002AAC1C39|nr:acylneuraminate cytidylyltransferase family protein [uncultured Methanoregula sp.]